MHYLWHFDLTAIVNIVLFSYQWELNWVVSLTHETNYFHLIPSVNVFSRPYPFPHITSLQWHLPKETAAVRNKKLLLREWEKKNSPNVSVKFSIIDFFLSVLTLNEISTREKKCTKNFCFQVNFSRFSLSSSTLWMSKCDKSMHNIELYQIIESWHSDSAAIFHNFTKFSSHAIYLLTIFNTQKGSLF